jgi:hypothetical protein
MVNDNDLLMVGTVDSQLPPFANIEANWSRGTAASNLAEVGATEPFDVLSLFAGGPAEMRAYATAAGSADILDDDRMRLEFSAPRELHNASAGANDASLASIARAENAPEFIRTRRDHARRHSGAVRADMMAKSDAYSIAYDDYVRALKIDPLDEASLKSFVRTAILTNRAQDALSWVKALTMDKTGVQAQIAVSKTAGGFIAERRSCRDRREGVRRAAAGARRVRTTGGPPRRCWRQRAPRPGCRNTRDRCAGRRRRPCITPQCQRSFAVTRTPHWTLPGRP